MGTFDEQAPAPGGVLRQEAARQHTDRPACARHRPESAEGLGALCRVALEGDRQDGKRRRGHQRREGPLQRPGPEQHGLVDGEAAQGRSSRESHQADHEHPPATPEVGDAAPEEEKPTEGQRVGRDHPLPVRHRDAERSLRRGQGDRDDRGVQYHHQLGDDHHGENSPALRVRLRHLPDLGTGGRLHNLAHGPNSPEHLGRRTARKLHLWCRTPAVRDAFPGRSRRQRPAR